MKRALALFLVIFLVVVARTAAAPEKKVVMICSPDPAWCDIVKAEFPRATGIPVEDLRLSAGEALARLRAERQNPSIDVWFGGTGDPHFVAAAEGITEFYQPKAWSDLRPQLTRVTMGKYIPLYTGLHGLAVNDALLAEKKLPAPERWMDLTNPAYKGLIAIPDPSTSGTAYLFVATLVSIYGEDRAFDLLKKIHRNVAQYTRSGGAPSLLTARGEVAIGVSFANDVLSRRVKGFKIRYVAPADGVAAEIGGLSLVRGALHRDSAIQFIEWAVTPEAQSLEYRVTFDIASNIHTTVPIFVPKLDSVNLLNYDYAKFGTPEVRAHLLKRWQAEVASAPR